MLFKILKFSSFIILGVIFILSGVLLYHFQSTSAGGMSYKLGGWLRSDDYGWISLTSDNCVLANKTSPGTCNETGKTYQVVVTSTNKISGYGWSPNVGWVCFGEGTNSTTGCTTASFGTPPSGSLLTSINSSTDQITGWAKVIAEPVGGWIKLGRGGSGGTVTKGEACYDCSCATSTPSSAPCPINYHNCKFCFSNNCFATTMPGGNSGGSLCPDNARQPAGATDPVPGGSGKIVSNCSLCHIEESIPDPVEGSTISRTICDKCDNTSSTAEVYGINRDPSDGYFMGWGWGGDYASSTGPGWVHSGKSAAIVYPWLETDYGSIYSYGNVRQRVKTPGKNATYCIFASSSLENVSSANCSAVSSTGQFDISFPSQGASPSVYKNILGKIDIAGLITADPDTGRNKYGNLVQKITNDPDWQSKIIGGLDNTVYVFSNPSNPQFNIFNSTVIKNGQGTKLGNGLVYIDGDLTIDNNILYSADPITDGNLKKLASIAWIVKGDIRINPNVTDLAGAFISLGAEGSVCQIISGGDPSYPEYDPSQHCGVIFSVKPTMSDQSKPLTVYGLAIAKAFDFHRTYANITQGSERVIYDGRLTANPPPGLKDLVEGLPVIRDFDIQQFK
ncbi:MAG: hypothetical protein WC516_00390 [Patescibacteria group bacterium]